MAPQFLNVDGKSLDAPDLAPLIDRNKITQLTHETESLENLHNPHDLFFLLHDMRNGIPAETSALDIIYHSHFIEHLSNYECIPFLTECFRCLKKGGIMRFAVPDFELWCRKYIAKDPAFFDWYKNTYLGEAWDNHNTDAMVFSGMLFNWGHKMAYDFETLALRLADVGFFDIKRMKWGESQIVPSLSTLESSYSDRKIESLVIECQKPL